MDAANDAATPPPTDPSRFVQVLLRAATQRARGIMELAAAEARLAALSGLAMVLLAMIAAAALVVAWVLLVACVLFLFAQSRLGWAIPAVFIAAAHAGLAFYLWQVTVRLSWNLTLPELRNTLATKAEKQNDGSPLVAR